MIDRRLLRDIPFAVLIALPAAPFVQPPMAAEKPRAHQARGDQLAIPIGAALDRRAGLPG
jgi:hypothetical protein